MIKFLLWCVLLVLCWPLAVLALVLYPIIWLVLLPFRFLGVIVSGVLEIVWAIVTLPALLLRKLRLINRTETPLLRFDDRLHLG